MTKYDLSDKVVIVTGASKGLGKCIVRQFLLSGATVVMATSTPAVGERSCQVLKEIGKTDWVKVDLTSEEDIKHMIAYTADKYGRIDFLINNAAITTNLRHDLHEYETSVVEKQIAVNVTGTYLCMKYAIEQMVKQGEGGIVNVSSGCTENIQQGLSVYAATKSAVNTFTRYAAREYGPKGIRINAVLPGGMNTEAMLEFQTQDPENYDLAASAVPLGKFADPAQVAQNIVWLCSEEASYVTGAKIVIDGGITL